MDITEENVVRHIRDRNEKAIAFLIQCYGGLLVSIIKRYVPYDRRDCEECLDDVLLAVWNQIDTFDPEKNTFKQWIAAIAKFRAIDSYRKARKHREPVTDAELAETLPGRQPLCDRQDVDEVLAHLTAGERMIFEKYYLEGVPSRELARQLDVKESWIHNKLSRGRQKLRRIFTSRNGV
ncbi:sigma-70 family RNA polymerase sigma factor [Cohnella massiliensis]|uniref:sigma-70 family RNA polymerase sigma factor n=1 Tax=Cohnella massiliensis TaxID=1816691 RepID=UPI0009BC519D|nr:sigma-70 family RNA polymerase sigma factor [Cohnella massiliensis]